VHAHRKTYFPAFRRQATESLDDDRRIEHVAVWAFEAQECFFQGGGGGSEKESETGAALE